MNDQDFSHALGYTSGIKTELAQKIRSITAELCNVDSSTILPSDDTEKLNSRAFDGWNEIEFLLRLEGMFDLALEGVQLPNFTMGRFFFLYKKNKPLDYGEWVKSVVEIVAPIIGERFGK